MDPVCTRCGALFSPAEVLSSNVWETGHIILRCRHCGSTEDLTAGDAGTDRAAPLPPSPETRTFPIVDRDPGDILEIPVRTDDGAVVDHGKETRLAFRAPLEAMDDQAAPPAAANKASDEGALAPPPPEASLTPIPPEFETMADPPADPPPPFPETRTFPIFEVDPVDILEIPVRTDSGVVIDHGKETRLSLPGSLEATDAQAAIPPSPAIANDAGDSGAPTPEPFVIPIFPEFEPPPDIPDAPPALPERGVIPAYAPRRTRRSVGAPRRRLAGIIAALAVLALLGSLLLDNPWRRRPAPVTTAAPPQPRFALLALSELAGHPKLARARVSLAAQQGSAEAVSPLELRDVTVKAEKYELLFERRGYQDVRRDLDLTGLVPVPALRELADALEFLPTEALRNSYAKGKGEFDAARYDASLLALLPAESLDPDYHPAHPHPANETPTVRALMDEARRRLAEADEWERRGREALARGNGAGVEAAARGIETRLGQGHERAERLRGDKAKADAAALSVRRSIDEARLEEAETGLLAFLAVSPRDPRGPVFRGEIDDVRAVGVGVRRIVDLLSLAYASNSPAAYDDLAVPCSPELLEALQEDTRLFLEAGWRLVSDRHEILVVRWQGRTEGAAVDVLRKVVLRADESADSEERSVRGVYRFARVEGGLRLKSIEN